MQLAPAAGAYCTDGAAGGGGGAPSSALRTVTGEPIPGKSATIFLPQLDNRPALGAKRADILHYFQAENFIIVSGGIGQGMLLAVLLNLLLMQHYPQPRLPLIHLPLSALAMWLLGQLAVLGQALRAATVSPVVATRAT